VGLFTRLASSTRAAPTGKSFHQFGQPQGSGSKIKGTVSPTFLTPGQPMSANWNGQLAIRQFLGHTWVYRCLRTKADTLAGLPFRAGPDPDDPSTTSPDAPLARLLGPASPQAPGGPNPTTTARALWAWSKVQYDVTGKIAWNLIDDGNGGVSMLYPLVSAALDPVPSQAGSTDWFDSFVYHTPTGDLPMAKKDVFYGWRPGADDWRQPESALQAANLPIQIAMACDQYMWSLLRNGMVASKIVVAPPFEDDGDRRAWEEQFFSEFSGFNNAGKTIFAEAENDYDSTGKLVDQAQVQVIDLSMKSVDAQLLQMVTMAKNDITLATGVPESLIGNASQRIYANADSEYRNFWTITMVSDITDFQDMVNVNLAPKLGPDVGWFDLSLVAALQPPQIFMPPAITDAINAGIINVDDAAMLLGIPNASNTRPGEDVETAPIGEESASTGAGAAGATNPAMASTTRRA
jgi:hypothetical protein